MTESHQSFVVNVDFEISFVVDLVATAIRQYLAHEGKEDEFLGRPSQVLTSTNI